MSHGGPIEITARDGIEWHQADQQIVAIGDARAVRGNVTVIADRLIAHYRKKADATAAAAPPAATKPAAPATGLTGDAADTGNTEIYRLEAIGSVHIYTTTDQATCDHAVYDIDQAVLVMTGRNLKVTTPQDVITARDAMEYWSQKHMAVARGDAVATTSDGRRLSGDTLVAYTTDPNAPPAAGQAAAAKPAPVKTVAASQDPLEASGKLQRVEVFGNVEIRTATQTARGDRGVYVPDTGIARLIGNARLTQGENQVDGAALEVNLQTGIYRLLSDPGARVHGLVVPNDAGGGGPAAPGAGAPR
jgi:lipopolysaccharide export system protein LptA